MNNASQVKVMGDQQVIFFKSQDDFAKALREGTGLVEQVDFTDEQVEE
ncbi:hypothetical protein [Planococcus sp. YIM B11945]